MPIYGDYTVGNFTMIRLDDYRSTVKYNQYYQGHPDVDVVEIALRGVRFLSTKRSDFFRDTSHMDLCIFLDHLRPFNSSDGDFSSSPLKPSLLMSESRIVGGLRPIKP